MERRRFGGSDLKSRSLCDKPAHRARRPVTNPTASCRKPGSRELPLAPQSSCSSEILEVVRRGRTELVGIGF
eukprot:13655350-Heterocapsa_arctica.AAC.1